MEEKLDIIRKIEELITSTLDYIKNLTPDNFDTNYYTALANLKLTRELRENLSIVNLPDELTQRIKKINLTAKLIKKEYDNVIGDYTSEMEKIRLEMRNTENKRKLASYSRGL